MLLWVKTSSYYELFLWFYNCKQQTEPLRSSCWRLTPMQWSLSHCKHPCRPTFHRPSLRQSWILSKSCSKKPSSEFNNNNRFSFKFSNRYQLNGSSSSSHNLSQCHSTLHQAEHSHTDLWTKSHPQDSKCVNRVRCHSWHSGTWAQKERWLFVRNYH